MKKIINVFCFILISTFVFSQQPQADPLQLMQGLEQGQNQFFQIGDYEFGVVYINKKYNEKEINKVLKSMRIKVPHEKYSDQNIDSENTVVAGKLKSDKHSDEIVSYKYYFFPVGEKTMKFVSMETLIPDSLIENAFLDAYLRDSLDKYIAYTDIDARNPTVINFLGREIKLGGTCYWTSVNNLQCPNNGQMDWSVYPTMEEAEKNRQFRIKSNKQKVLKTEEVNIIFEGVPVTATRIVYKFNIPKFMMGGSNTLAVFYVAGKVRGQYVSCVLSNYVKNEDHYYLAALLSEVIEWAE